MRGTLKDTAPSLPAWLVHRLVREACELTTYLLTPCTSIQPPHAAVRVAHFLNNDDVVSSASALPYISTALLARCSDASDLRGGFGS